MQNQAEDFPAQESFILDVLLVVGDSVSVPKTGSTDLPDGVRPPNANEKGKIEVVPVVLSCIHGIGHVRIFLPKDLKSQDQRSTVRKSLDEVQRRFPDGIALLDPVDNMQITDDSFKKLIRVRFI